MNNPNYTPEQLIAKVRRIRKFNEDFVFPVLRTIAANFNFHEIPQLQLQASPTTIRFSQRKLSPSPRQSLMV